jgi:Tol biopolymer transport system component/DNA-binding winged helix-turn-helix (wHTH) protein
MNYASHTVKGMQAISLAGQADFALGDLSISPSQRMVKFADRHETIEPRVMQVLVALATAEGEVVSRDQLIERCWGGRLVGDDAINSCVAKVRALALLPPQAAFEIETIPRVGYRLRGIATASVAAATVAPPVTTSLQTAMLPRAILWIGAAAAIVCMAVVAGYLYFARPHEWTIVESHLSFISTPLIERYPAFSPDGTMIAYSAGADVFSRKIYLRLLTGGEPIALTNDAFDAYSPAWSPDGTTIAYLVYREKEPCRIMLVPVPSGASRQVGRCQTSARSTVTWDRAGHALLYADSALLNRPSRILRLDLDSGKMSELTHPAAVGAYGDASPSASPDGTTLMFERGIAGGTTQILLRARASGSERILLQSNDDGIAEAWSADSSTVFMTRSRPGDSSLWAYPVSGAAPRRITTSPIEMARLSSGPGGLLAMELTFAETDLSAAPTTADAAPRVIDSIGLNACMFDYAPDGTLVLLAHRSGTASIWLGNPGGRFRELLRLNADRTCGIRWSPDGSRFAYGVSGGDGFSVVVLDRSGATVTRIRNPTRDFGGIEWSADGKSLLLSRLDAHGWRIWRTDLGEPHRSVPVLPYGWAFVRTHGAMLLGVKDGEAGVWRIDGKPRRLTAWPSAEFPWLWAVWGDRVVYPDHSDPAHPVFMAQPIDGGSPVTIGHPAGLSVWGSIAVDPKTGQVTYLRWKRDDTDIGWIRIARQ